MPTRRQAIIWTNDGIVYWRIYASLGLNELTQAMTRVILFIRSASVTRRYSVTPSLIDWAHISQVAKADFKAEPSLGWYSCFSLDFAT